MRPPCPAAWEGSGERQGAIGLACAPHFPPPMRLAFRAFAPLLSPLTSGWCPSRSQGPWQQRLEWQPALAARRHDRADMDVSPARGVGGELRGAIGRHVALAPARATSQYCSPSHPPLVPLSLQGASGKQPDRQLAHAARRPNRARHYVSPPRSAAAALPGGSC